MARVLCFVTSGDTHHEEADQVFLVTVTFLDLSAVNI